MPYLVGAVVGATLFMFALETLLFRFVFKSGSIYTRALYSIVVGAGLYYFLWALSKGQAVANENLPLLLIATAICAGASGLFYRRTHEG
jgi:hypothetical protein